MGSREDEVYPNETRSTVPSTVGGVMTQEVGAVTGDLEVATSALRELHESVAGHLTTPGMVVDGNEQATSLLRFSPVAGNG